MYDEYLEKLEEVGKFRNLKPRTIQTYQNNILSLLTQYWFACGRPKDILFPNKFNGRPLTISSVEQVIYIPTVVFGWIYRQYKFLRCQTAKYLPRISELLFFRHRCGR